MKLKSKFLVTTNKTIFQKYQNELKKLYYIKKIQIENEKVTFYSNELIDIEGFESIDLVKNMLREVFVKNLIFTITILIMFICICLTPYYIRDIRYTEDSVEDESIYEIVVSKLNKTMQKKVNLNAIANELSLLFPHYAFIGLKRIGSIVYLNIELQDVVENQIDTNAKKGNLISSYDAYIKSIKVEKGYLTINTNQLVKKGDLLVSGNLKYAQNIQDEKFLVSPKGIIIGNVIEFKTFKIDKKNTFLSSTGDIYTYDKILLFGKQINNKKEIYNGKHEKSLFKLGNFFQVIRVDNYNQKEISFEYNEHNIIDYVKSLVYYGLEKNRISDNEKINKIEVLKIIEEKNRFTISLLIDKDINIAVFQEIA